MAPTSIQSEGDLEVVVLYETHGLLADLIGPDLYTIGGTAPEQTALPHDTPSFKLFLILLIELFAEGARSASINNKFLNCSLLKGVAWLNSRYPAESAAVGLDVATSTLSSWLETEVPVEFWCPDVDTQITLNLTRAQLISVASNATKHHLLRLTELVGKLEGWCTKAGYQFSPQQLSAVLACLLEEASNNRVRYHQTYILEMLGNLFLAVNEFIWNRFRRNPTNDTRKMDHPAGVTSDVFRDLYGSVLVFKRYDRSRITDFTPSTSQYLRSRY